MNKPNFPSNIFSTAEYTLAHLIIGHISPESIAVEQWDQLIDLANKHGLAGMLLTSLRRAEYGHIRESRWEPVITWLRQSGRRSILLEKTRWLINEAFAHAKIPTIWMKGAFLAYKYYPAPHLRPMGDLDVLVHSEHMAAARAALLTIGFQPERGDFAEIMGFEGQARHHICLIDRTGQIKVELHFRLLDPEIHKRLDEGGLDWFWSQSEAFTPNGQSFQVLKPEAALLHLCAHAILQNREKGLDLLHLLDMHLLIGGSLLDWDLVVEQACELHWTFAVGVALGMLPDLFGTQLPEGLLDRLKSLHLPEEESLFALSSSQGTRRWDEWRQVFRGLSMRSRLRFIWLTLFPPSEYMRKLYHLSPNQSLLAYYISHFIGGGREATRALLKDFYSRKL